ncbi:hypothetical protein ACFLRX_02360 [Acidobacteriota bacterium]
MKSNNSIFKWILVIILWVGFTHPVWGQSAQKAGFYTLEEINTYFHTGSYFNRTALRSSKARMWYVFQPANEDSASKPLFVFFNGGPGGATSSGLLSAYTGNKAVLVDKTTGTSSVINNPHSWTQIGNLLHIDARTTGFSYSLMESPSDAVLRKSEFDAQNYNYFFDGADFIRVILRFLSDHPELQKNRVVIVGESYGGIRASSMLHLLHYYEKYENGQAVYQDPALVQEIRTHYSTVFPGFQGQTVPREVISQQFGHQILIQAAVSRYNQRLIATQILEAPGSILDQLASETGVLYVRWKDQPWNSGTPTPNQIMNNVYAYLETINRDPYIYSKPDGFLWGFFTAAADLLIKYNTLNQMIGMDSANIPELYASARLQAYKTILNPNAAAQISFSTQLDLPEKKRLLHSIFFPAMEDDFTSIFGVLQPWDRYFIDLNDDANTAFTLNKTTFYGYELRYSIFPLFGQMFLENVALVETFFTNADYDIVVYSPSLPDALALHSDILFSSIHDSTGPSGAARPGQIHLNYRASSVPGADVSTTTIRFPRYTKSGHAVTLTEPKEMLDDVKTWLGKSGVTFPVQKGEKK